MTPQQIHEGNIHHENYQEEKSDICPFQFVRSILWFQAVKAEPGALPFLLMSSRLPHQS